MTLTVNDGNVKRTARGLAVPESTVRRWRDMWRDDGPPDLDVVEEAATTFVIEAERVRDRALQILDGKLEGATPSALVAVVGVLTDKVAVARGLATSRTEHIQALPPPEEIAKSLAQVLQGAIAAAQERQSDISDAEFTEVNETLPELAASPIDE